MELKNNEFLKAIYFLYGTRPCLIILLKLVGISLNKISLHFGNNKYMFRAVYFTHFH